MTPPSAVTVLLILYSTKLGGIEAGTLTISTIPSPPVLGTTGFKVRCTYGVGADELFFGIYIMSSTKPNAKIYASITYVTPDGPGLWSKTVTPESLRNRATITHLHSLRYVEICFPNTKCEDINTTYLFKLSSIEQPSRNLVEKTEPITIDIVARPEPPTPIEVTNATLSSCVEPGTKVTFECSANVGRPANNSGLLWYLVKEDGSVQNVTDRATVTGSELLAGEPSCTFRKCSTLTMTFDRKNYSGKTSVRCAVNHPKVNYALCTVPSVHFCQKAPNVCLKENKTKSNDTDSGDSSQTVNAYTILGTSSTTVILGILAGLVAVIFFGMVAFFFCRHKSTAISRSRVPSVGHASTPASVVITSLSHAVPPTYPSLGSSYSSAETSQYTSEYSSPLSNVDDDLSSVYSARSSVYY